MCYASVVRVSCYHPSVFFSVISLNLIPVELHLGLGHLRSNWVLKFLL